jgi:biopolymer transport protein ExbB/TolQ
MQPIHDLLYLISNAFLVPTLLGTLAAFAYSAYVVGRFLSDWVDYRSNRGLLASFFAGPPTQSRFESFAWRADYARFFRALRQHREFPAMVEKEVADIEHDMTARVDALGIMSKVGPMLGLIGTLIPLQPALAGLARGDMPAMGANLQIGFTTTVLGLLVGGTCHAISAIVRNWNQQTATNFHFLLELWMPEQTAHRHEPLPEIVHHQIETDGLANSGTSLHPENHQ